MLGNDDFPGYLLDLLPFIPNLIFCSFDVRMLLNLLRVTGSIDSFVFGD